LRLTEAIFESDFINRLLSDNFYKSWAIYYFSYWFYW